MNQNQNKNMTDQEITKEFAALTKLEKKNAASIPKINKLQEQIFWYKAQQHGPFKLGSKEFWEISKDLHSDDEEESYDPKNTGKKGPKINVKKSKW